MSRPGLDEPTECPRGAARRDGGGVALLRRAEDGRWAGHQRRAARARPCDGARTAGGRDRVGRWSANRRRTPLIAQAVVCGEGRPYPVALLALDEPEVRAWAAARGLGDDLAALCAGAELRAELQRALDAVNAHLARPAQVKRFALLPRPPSVERGELTPSLKLRRAIVAGAFAETIEDLYARAPRSQHA